jgi:hypothetical protein
MPTAMAAEITHHQQIHGKLRWWLRPLDFSVLAAYSLFVLVGVAHHEPWADEAEAWLLARNLPFSQLMFHELHYEGSPGLWHSILWIAQHWFHAPYAALGWIGATIAIAGVAVMLFAAPFPRVVRYLLASSYFISYQYAIVARPYVLGLLLVGLSATFYRRRQPVKLAICLALLCGMSLHGATLAGALAVVYALDVRPTWTALAPVDKRRHLLALAITLVGFAMVFAVATPNPQASALHSGLDGGGPAKLVAAATVPFATPWPLGLAALVGLGVFAVIRRATLLYVLGVVSMIVFVGLLYGAPHHEGTIILAAIALLWIGWPQNGEPVSPRFLRVTTAAVCLVLAVQTWWAISAWSRDYRLPYSGAEDAAAYIRASGVPIDQIYGAGYGLTSLQAYFPDAVFAGRKYAYFHHSHTEEPMALRDILGGPVRIEGDPEMIVRMLWVEGKDQGAAELAARGYYPVHVSPGLLFFKQVHWVSQTYIIYRKRH